MKIEHVTEASDGLVATIRALLPQLTEARTPPTLAVLLYQGKLRWEKGAENASEDADAFAFRHFRFCLARRFVYASIYRRCDPPPAASR